ncbi:hypothetical protein N8J89_30280 [Crossiella sp. CA-258035]|uniref:hypothetical protein n=1 Tax=Crossiella sp. CA-258035 TaxID=2981138 RepID=UPI0024BC559A|nr:hypothetical protein [Crossiella sp. CA-258035]WHT17392.1 hypothetical protein N8J89_30280 [Crossiella sp. CA-258035]
MADRTPAGHLRGSAVWWDRLSTLSDTVLLGLLVAACAVPVLTLPAGFAAACAVTARWRHGEAPALLPVFRATLGNGLRRHLLAGTGFLAVTALLTLNLMLLADLELPGGWVLHWLVRLVTLCAFALLLLAAAIVGATGRGWLAAARVAYDKAVLDPGGFLLVALALAAAGALVWALPPLLLVVAGPLAVAATAVSLREEP